MQFAITKNSEGKGNKYLETFLVVGRAASISQSRTPTAQDVREQPKSSRLFLVCPEAGEPLSQSLPSSEILGAHESSFPRSLLRGLRKEGTK